MKSIIDKYIALIKIEEGLIYSCKNIIFELGDNTEYDRIYSDLNFSIIKVNVYKRVVSDLKAAHEI